MKWSFSFIDSLLHVFSEVMEVFIIPFPLIQKVQMPIKSPPNSCFLPSNLKLNSTSYCRRPHIRNLFKRNTFCVILCITWRLFSPISLILLSSLLFFRVVPSRTSTRCIVWSWSQANSLSPPSIWQFRTALIKNGPSPIFWPSFPSKCTTNTLDLWTNRGGVFHPDQPSGTQSERRNKNTGNYGWRGGGVLD